MKGPSKRSTVTFEQLTYSNMLTLNALVELLTEKEVLGAALTKASDLLGGSTIDGVATWADDYRCDHPETRRWHYIDIPLADSKIDVATECPNGDCVIAKTEYFLGVLRDPKADREPIPRCCLCPRLPGPLR